MHYGKVLYVDKTKQIHEIVTEGKAYFLSRPRRFGKSLLCSTLGEIFKGNKELFKGLWIYDSNYDWKSYPVIRFDMTEIAHKTPEELEKALNEKINLIAKQNNIKIDKSETLPTKFSIVIEELSKKNKIAIIIDEYDKPILDHIKDTKNANGIRDVLRNFYAQLKANDQYIKFIFITGVTRFTKTSIFSCLNNLKDITIDDRFSTMLGYTQEEIHKYFKKHIELASKKLDITEKQILTKIKDWYNGYKFSKKTETVYNPYSILLFLDMQDFRNYWFESGTPTFLVDVIRQKSFDYTDPKSFIIGELQIGNFDIENINVKTLLVQAGYLTISRYEQRRYYLKYPNKEAEESLLEVLLESFSGIDSVISGDSILEITDALRGV